ncbi:VTT domain-containing protein [Methylicorpusculum oleiharenae]|uniref:TVP38/TMEM64 family protein n=1 Tax=Methylicorpusculum oleiharenae TaxID=1338687 RepID=UPI001357470D|nr:VTT domain-containing protein [Methylicorpusculum oleiharenae]MCD2451865.1 VTT domain-containing protein [Methylicorpusculum oleiharenae]
MNIVKNWLIILLVLIIILSLYSSDIITLDNVKNNEKYIRYFISNNYFFSVVMFFTSCIIFINSPIPLAAVLKVLGGFFFGFYLGAVYNIAATLAACLIGFLISRYSFNKVFKNRYLDKLDSIGNEIEKNGFYYFLSLRLVMFVPYFLINILGGISRISFKKYLLSTLIGVTPASLIYANGGNQLDHIHSIKDLFSFDILFSIVIVATITLLPVFLKNNKGIK